MMRATVHATVCAAVLTGSDSNRGETGLTCDFAPFSGRLIVAEGRAAGSNRHPRVSMAVSGTV